MTRMMSKMKTPGKHVRFQNKPYDMHLGRGRGDQEIYIGRLINEYQYRSTDKNFPVIFKENIHWVSAEFVEVLTDEEVMLEVLSK